MTRTLLIAAALLSAFGCSRDDRASSSASQPASAARLAAEKRANTLPDNSLLPESKDWTVEEAVSFLIDERRGISAAVRLVRLADVTSPIVPEPLVAEAFAALRLVRLSEERFALGARDSHSERRLLTPILINANGRAQLAAAGATDAVLIVSEDAEVFPHVVIARRSLFNLAAEDEPALTVKQPEDAHFALRTKNAYPYVALLIPRAGDEPIEVARYVWDPYELNFAGPAADKLLEPLSGRFELDVAASAQLQPVGGEVAEPVENTPPKRTLDDGTPEPF